MAHARLMAVLVLAACGLGACASSATPSPSMHEALAAAEGARTESQPPAAAVKRTFGYQAPHTPLVVPPDVRRIWVPTHVTEEGSLVQGHWVFVPVTTWQWFVERPLNSDGLGVGVPPDATPPPWRAPIQSRRTIVPWTLDPKAQPMPAPMLDPSSPAAGPAPQLVPSAVHPRPQSR